MTYIWTWEGWLFLAAIVDIFSRRVVGWAMADHLRTELPLEALGIALGIRQPEHGLVHHSDRGCQYASELYRAELSARGTVCSMSRVGDCWDNAVAESFFATLKTELIHHLSLDMSEAQRERLSREGIPFQRTAALSSSRYEVRLTVRAAGAGAVGMASQWVEMPDLTAERLVLSSLFLMRAGEPAGPESSLVLSQARRRFRRDEPCTCGLMPTPRGVMPQERRAWSGGRASCEGACLQ